MSEEMVVACSMYAQWLEDVTQVSSTDLVNILTKEYILRNARYAQRDFS